MKHIYVLIDPRDNRVRYVGASVKPHKRLNLAIAKAEKRTWFLELESLNLRPTLQIIETVNDDDSWTARERYWISYYRSMYNDLTNVSDGGPGAYGVKRSDETRAKMSAAQIGKTGKHSPEGIAALREKGGAASRKFWVNATPEQREEVRLAGMRGWANISPEERTRRAVERNKRAWDKEGERERRGKLISEAIMRRSPESRRESARAGGLATAAKQGSIIK
jgi:GIY-YIG catalytic domain-containing protein